MEVVRAPGFYARHEIRVTFTIVVLVLDVIIMPSLVVAVHRINKKSS